MSYDISAGTYNTDLTDSSDVDENESTTDSSKTSSVNAVASLSSSDFSITPNYDVTYENLIEQIVGDYDDAMDKAYDFSENSFGVNYADGSAEYAATAIDQLEEGADQMASTFSQLSQMAYNIQQIYVNLEGEYDDATAAQLWGEDGGYEDMILAQMTQEYNSGVQAEVVDFGSLQEAYGYILTQMSPSVEALGTFINNMSVDVGTLQDIEEANASTESWLNTVMQVSTAVIGASTGVSSLQAISTGYSSYVAGSTSAGSDLLSAATAALSAVGINTALGSSEAATVDDTTFEDYSSFQISLSDYSEEMSSLLRTMETSDNTAFNEAANDFFSFATDLQAGQELLAENLPEFGLYVGTTAQLIGGDLAERDASSNDAFDAMADLLSVEAFYSSGKAAGATQYQHMFTAQSGELRGGEEAALEIFDAFVAQEVDRTVAYAVAYQDNEFISVREIDLVFLNTEDLAIAENEYSYQFATPFNVDLYT